MNRIAVLGVAGFSGRHFERLVVQERLTDNAQFFGLALPHEKTENTRAFEYTAGDGAHEADIEKFLTAAKPTHILNLVGMFRGSFEALYRANAEVARLICETVIRNKMVVQKIVVVGSAAEYGLSVTNPVREDAPLTAVSPYGLTKIYQTLLAEYYFRNFGLPVVVARTFNILGEGLMTDLSIGSFMHQIAQAKDGDAIRVGNITTSRDFLHISEVCRRYWKLLQQGQAGEVYNICAGEPTEIRAVLDDLIAKSGKKLKIEVDPERFKANDVPCIYGDGSKFESLAG